MTTKDMTLDSESLKKLIDSFITNNSLESLSNKIDTVESFVSMLDDQGYSKHWIQFVAKPAIVAIIHSYETPALNYQSTDNGIISAKDNSGNTVRIIHDSTRPGCYQSFIYDSEGHYLSGSSGPFIESAKAYVETNMDCELDSNESVLKYYNSMRKMELIDESYS